MKTLHAIQYLRAFAVLSVVVYHASQWRSSGFDLGRAGVDVFFVISGVIMWRLTSVRERSPAAFLWSRVTRVAPLYWLITLGVAAIGLAWPAFLPNVHPAWAHLALSLGFIPHLDPKGLPFPMLPPGWSLNYEAVFYCVFAGALLAPRRHQAAVVFGALASVVAFGLLVYPPAYFLGANPMLLQFAAGVALADLGDRFGLPRRAGGAGLLCAGLGALIVPAWLGVFSELWRPLIWGLPAVLIVAGALSLEASNSVPRWRTVNRIGDASYSIYLVHLPATALIAHTLGVGNAWLFYPAAISASLAAGLACHRWIEAPLVRFARLAPGAFSKARPAPAA